MALGHERADAVKCGQPARVAGSTRRGVEGGQQVGTAIINMASHASLWHGSAGSWVDLHPSSYWASQALAVFGGYQVGWVQNSTFTHAAIWNGSAASMIDLHACAPLGFGSSTATGVRAGATTLYVIGHGNDGQDAGLLWSMPLAGSSLATNAQLGAGCSTLALAATTRPVLGSTWELIAAGLPAGTQFGVTVLGGADPGILNLAFLGLPGCQLRASVDVVLGPWLPTAATWQQPLAIPASPASLTGFALFAPAATFVVPAPNAFGALTSNGVVGVRGDH